MKCKRKKSPMWGKVVCKHCVFVETHKFIDIYYCNGLQDMWLKKDLYKGFLSSLNPSQERYLHLQPAMSKAFLLLTEKKNVK